jgi:hypothetical protein
MIIYDATDSLVSAELTRQFAIFTLQGAPEESCDVYAVDHTDRGQTTQPERGDYELHYCVDGGILLIGTVA